MWHPSVQTRTVYMGSCSAPLQLIPSNGVYLSVVVRRGFRRRARQTWHHDISINRTANTVVQQDVPGWYGKLVGNAQWVR
jgi:hypothetical protein